VIDRYTEESVKDIGRTKTQVLRAIKRYDIANRPCSTITSADIIVFANQLVSKVTPQTVGNYLSHLAQYSRSLDQRGDISLTRTR